MVIKVVTFNIHHGRGIDGKLKLSRIAEVIEKSEADLVGLNEVDRYFSRRSDYMDQVSWLAKQLKMNHVFGASLTIKSRGTTMLRQYGNALLSRYPIISEENHPLDFYSGMIEGRALLEINVLIHEQLLKIYVTHLSLNPLLHKKQTDFIVNKIVNDHQPVIILGDWNMRPGGRGWNTITGHLADVCYETGKALCYTFPSFRPKLQLDYIFASRNINIASVEVIKKIHSASDHLPLKATLILGG